MRAAVRAAREQERKKAKTAREKALEKAKAGWKADRGKVVEKAREKATEEQKAKLAKMKRHLEAAKKRALDKESAAAESAKRLKRAKTAEAALKERAEEELQAALEEESDDEESDDEESDYEEAGSGGRARKSARSAAERSRRDSRGRYLALPNHLRVLIWAQLSRRVAPSAINANISDAIGALAPEELVPLPCERSIGEMRAELTVASEAIAAFRVALSKRIVSFGWDESSKFGLGLLSSNTQIEMQDGEIVDVVMRGASLTAGGTAEAISWSIDKKIFAHARRLLEEWRTEHERRFGAGSWAAAGGPAPGSIAMHRLTEDTLLMSDTCNAARACKRLIAAAAMDSLRLKVGEDAWAKLSEAQKAEKGKVYVGECHAHLRNIIINAMASAATAYLKDELRDSLSEFSSFDRMSVDGNDLIRAVFKELHEGGEYAKGKGREFWAWVRYGCGSTTPRPPSCPLPAPTAVARISRSTALSRSSSTGRSSSSS